MLTYNLSTIFLARGVKNGYTFLKKLGIGHMAAINLNAGNVRSIRLDHIEKICLKLNCTPNDLLKWTPEGLDVPEHHTLNQLKEKRDALNLLEDANDLPFDRLMELKEKLEELKKNNNAG